MIIKIIGLNKQKIGGGISSEFFPKRPRRCQLLGKPFKASCCLLILQKSKVAKAQHVLQSKGGGLSRLSFIDAGPQ